MARRVLALIRHGEYAQPAGVPSAHLPYGLTSSGRAQAREAARAVLDLARTEGLDLHPVIDCSSLRRAWETAQLLASALQESSGVAARCQQFDALCERSLGALANLSVEAIEEILRDDPRYDAPPAGWKRDPDYRLPHTGCESLAQAGTRVADHLRRCAADLGAGGRSQLKLVVGHGGAFRHAARELGVLSTSEVARLSMGYATPVYLEVGDGAGRFAHLAGRWRDRDETQPVD